MIDLYIRDDNFFVFDAKDCISTENFFPVLYYVYYKDFMELLQLGFSDSTQKADRDRPNKSEKYRLTLQLMYNSQIAPKVSVWSFELFFY